MKTRKPRRLTDEEEALWRRVVEKTARLAPERAAPVVAPPSRKPVIKQGDTAPIRPFRVGEAVRPSHTPPPHPVRHGQPPAMDHKAFRKLKGGKIAPEARIDLHGMTLAEAQPRLTRFILDAVADGCRLVLVITGKGRGDPDQGPLPTRPGALRHSVPHWLHSAPLKSHVLQVHEAHRRHGGQGAIYVYLRRGR